MKKIKENIDVLIVTLIIIVICIVFTLYTLGRDNKTYQLDAKVIYTSEDITIFAIDRYLSWVYYNEPSDLFFESEQVILTLSDEGTSITNDDKIVSIRRISEVEYYE